MSADDTLSTQPIYIEMDSDIRDFIASSGLSIPDILQKEGIDATVKFVAPPYQSEEGARTKDVVTLIIASGAVASLVIAAISKLLQTYYNRPIRESYWTLKPMTDDNGNIVYNDDGNPRMTRVQEHVFIQPRPEDRTSLSKITAGLKNGIAVEFSSEEKQK